MKKSLVIGLFLVFILLAMPLASAGILDWLGITGQVTNETIECTDSDGGQDFYTKGTATGIYAGGLSTMHFIYGDGEVQQFEGAGETIYYDHCGNDVQLNEGFCMSDGRLGAMAEMCANGCENGACIEEQTCIDSDGGKDYYKYGSAGVPCTSGECPACTYACMPGEICPTCSGATDRCNDDVTLYEGYCDGADMKMEEYICPNGCENGACLAAPEPGVCAASISISFDKSVYYTGDYATLRIEVFDSAGNRIPNYAFNVGIYEYSTDHWDYSPSPEYTNNEGYFETGGAVDERVSTGKILYKAYTEETTTCAKVEDSVEVEFRPKENGGGECLGCPGCPGCPIEPEPAPTTCAAKISISFDKDVYYVGDPFKVVMEVFDSQGNHLPGYAFYIQIYNYDSGAWKNIGEDRTDESGYRIHQERMNIDEPLQYGENKIKIYSKEYSGCSRVEDSATIEIRPKEGPIPTPIPVPCGMGECVPIEEDEVEPIDIPEEEMFYSCQGCESEGKCYPVGYRKKGQYCTVDKKFTGQRGAGECDNNFECQSNVCLAGDCLTTGFIQRIINWLKEFFGMKPKPPEEVKCSKLLFENNIGDFRYVESSYGGDEHTQAPLISENGEHIGAIKCCAAQYIHKDKDEVKMEDIKAAIVCPYNSREEMRNSLLWILSKEGMPDKIEYNGQDVLGDINEVIIWTHDAYLVASGGDSRSGTPISEDVAKDYLKRYPSDLDLTEDEIPKGEPKLIYCSKQFEDLKEECHFTDDFESGLGKWDFSSPGAGSEVVENGNTVLKLVGVERANIRKSWDNYLFKFKFKMIDGSVHVDFRRSEGHEFGANRYLVSMHYGNIPNLNKQMGEDWRKLEQIDARLDGNWHTLEIRCYNNIINVYLDNELISKHKDTINTLYSGWVRFEAHTGGVPGMIPELLIDDVEVKLIEEKDIVYP